VINLDIRQKKKFFYSQNSLKTFLECPKKFKYRYIEGISWSRSDDLVKEAIEDGETLHSVAERYFLGIEDDFYYKNRDKTMIWMENLKKAFPLKTEDIYRCEYEIRQRKEGINMMARYDLINFKFTGEIEIFDWKTNKTEFDKKVVEDSLQTKIYLFLLTENLNLFNINYFKFKNISMTYWQVKFPHSPIKIEYSSQSHNDNKAYIKNLIETIDSYDFENCKKVPIKSCNFCEFSSICKD